MQKAIAAGVVIAVAIVAAVLAMRSGQPPADTTAHPQLDALLVQCDAGGSSFSTMYRAMIDPARKFLTSDPARAVTIMRGQVANVIDGRIATCERALAVAQHDKRGSAVMAVGPFVEKLKVAHAALGELTAALDAGSDAGSDAAAKLAALDAAALDASAH